MPRLILFLIFFLFNYAVKKTTAYKSGLVGFAKTTDYGNNTGTLPFVKITGETKEIDGAMVIVSTEDFKNKIWTGTIKNNSFLATFPLKAPGFYLVSFQGKYPKDSIATGWLHGFKIYFEENHYYRIVTGTDWDILHNRHTIYSNSAVENKLIEFDKTYWRLFENMQNDQFKKSMMEKALSGNSGTIPEKSLARMTKEIDSLKRLLTDLPLTFALKNPNSVVSTNQLVSVGENDLKSQYTRYKAAYDNLSETLKMQKDGILFKEKLQKIKQD